MSKSPNNSSRQGWLPDCICQHVTEGGFSGAVSWLCNTASQASAHFVLGANGQREQLVDLDRMAWCNGTTTAGCALATNPIVKSRKTNTNYFTFSIENEGYSYKERCGALTEEQFQANLQTCKEFIQYYEKVSGKAFQIDRDHIFGHYEVSPSAKPNCPAPGGKNFPFDRLISDLKAWKGQPAPASVILKSINEVAQEVINGQWGNGEDRKNRIANAGYDYNAVQSAVNQILGGSGTPAPSLKPIDTIAREVIRGAWGNGQERKDRLTQAGYNYNEVQAKVNALV